jgi:hypothetical protein
MWVQELYVFALCRTAKRERRVGKGAAIYSIDTAVISWTPERVYAVEIHDISAFGILKRELNSKQGDEHERPNC